MDPKIDILSCGFYYIDIYIYGSPGSEGAMNA